MITTTSVLTLSLAKALGAYMLAGGLSGFIGGGRWARIMDGFRDNAALTYVTGILVFALGASIIMAHNIWTDPLAIVVSLTGWIAIVEGLLFIACPGPLMKLADSMMRPGVMTGFAAFAIIAGLLLLTLGLVGTAG